MAKIHRINIILLLVLLATTAIITSNRPVPVAAAVAQCYTASSDGTVSAPFGCPVTNFSYTFDNGFGANAPIIDDVYVLNEGDCYMESRNLYGGNIENTGIPYVRFDCGSFECEPGEELRYTRDEGYNPPSCIDQDAETEVFVDPPAGGSLNSVAAKNALTDNSAVIESSLDGDCKDSLTVEDCGIIKIIVDVINALTILVGISVIGSIMWAGFQYMTARDNQGQIQKAKIRIVWAVVALGMYIFMYAILNFVVPGGVI